MQRQIKDLFTDLKETLESGLWFSGYEKEGVYKRWNDSGKLVEHKLYKKGEITKDYSI